MIYSAPTGHWISQPFHVCLSCFAPAPPKVWRAMPRGNGKQGGGESDEMDGKAFHIIPYMASWRPNGRFGV